MKRLLWATLSLPALALSWAALHDIRHGEPDLGNEYAAITLCAVLLGVSAWKSLRPAGTGASR